MTEDKLSNVAPRLSWWKDVKGRTWIITGYTYHVDTWLPSRVEMLQLFEGVPAYVNIADLLRSIESGQMKRLIDGKVVG